MDDKIKTKHELAKQALTQKTPKLAFHFTTQDNQCLVTVKNLIELNKALPDISPEIIQFHVYRKTTNKLFPSDQFHQVIERSDLALWVDYVLTDTELASLIFKLGSVVKDPFKLKELILETCKKREIELSKFI